MDAIVINAPDERAIMMLIRWLVADGVKVAENTSLCEVEIAWVYESRIPVRQTVVPLKSPAFGTVEQIAREGKVLGPGEEIGRIIPWH
ncbi:MAG TPA: hypothetical protein VGI81_10735 [Tepidisphaeraceae bacterium]|jgi:hypothetical protein